MNVNCIHCGHRFDLGKSYDDYEGPVRCPTCRAMLSIRTQDGNIRGVRPGMVSFSDDAAQNGTKTYVDPPQATYQPQPSLSEDRRNAA